MRMIRVRVDEFDFDWLTARAESQGYSLAGFVRDVLHAIVMEAKPVSEGDIRPSDTEPEPEPEPEPLPAQRSGVGRPTRDQWERMNKWMAATGRAPATGEVTTRSGLLAWAVSQGFQP